MRRLVGLVWLGMLVTLAGEGAARQAASAPALPPPTVKGPPALPAAPPPPNLNSALEQIRAERAELERQRRETAAQMGTGSGKDAAARLQLRVQIAELLQRIKGRDAGPTPATAPGMGTSIPRGSSFPVLPPAEAPARPGSAQADPLAVAQAQFRGRDFAGAVKTLAAIDRSELSGRDRLWLDYLKASCLKHLGKVAEASALYREVANDKEEAFLSESAAWQLSFLSWKQEIQGQLKALREKAP